MSLPVVPGMVEAQRRAAQAEECAFFDTYQAIGDEGAAGRWFRRNPWLVSGDLSHLTIRDPRARGGRRDVLPRADADLRGLLGPRRLTRGMLAAWRDGWV